MRHAGQDCLVFHPFGRFIGFYGPQRILATRVLGLHPTFLSRAVYAFTAGLTSHLAAIYAERAIRQQLTVVYVGQGPSPLSYGCKIRVPHSLWLPAWAACAASDRRTEAAHAGALPKNR